MHRIRRALFGPNAGLLTASFICVLVLSLAACGRREEPAPPPPAEPVTEVVEPTPDLPTTPAIKETPEPSVIARERTHYPPSTAPVLALRPEAAMMSLALPPMQGAIDRGTAYAERVLPPEVPVRAEMTRWVEQFAEDLDIENAETLSDIAAGIGLDPERPMGVFLGGDRLLEAIAELEAQAAVLVEAAAEAEAGEEDSEEPMLDEDGELRLDALEAIDFDRAMETPEFALLLPCADCPKVVETFLSLANDLPDFDADEAIEVEVGDITILQYGDTVSYFVTDEWFAVGTALELVTGIANRFDEPATTKYGTPACPAYSPEEIVALVRADQLAGIMEAGTRVSFMLGANLGATAMGQIEESVRVFRESPDPVVVTLRLDEDEFEILSRVDTAERPGMFEVSGEPGPLTLTAALPPGTPAFIGWRLTGEQREQLAEQIAGGRIPLPGDARSSIERLLGVLGDEVVVATTGTGLLPIAPRFVIMFRVTDMDEFEDMLSELKAATGIVFVATDFDGVEINTLAPGTVPILTLSYAIVDDAVMFSVMAADSSELISIVDSVLEETPSGLFSSLDPPLDPTAPMYRAMVFNAAFAREMSRTAGMFNPEIRTTTEPMGRFLDATREVRVVSGMQGDWMYQQVTMYIVPAPADLPPRPAAGTK